MKGCIGMATYSKGLEGVIAAETKLSFIDGEKGILEYVGIPIGELASNSTFEETVFLLWNGRLPRRDELAKFSSDLKANYDLDKNLARLVLEMPKTAEPMHVVRSLVSALGCYDPKPNAIDLPSIREKALRILGQVPAMLMYFHHHRTATPIVPPDKSMSYAENTLYMLNGKRPTATMARAMDVCLILHTDHGLNNSTFSARSVISTESDIYSALSAAIGSLRGPLHGGANEGVMKMLNQIPTVNDAEKFIQNKLEKKEKIPGFGHRVYKSYDPRAAHLKVLAKQLAQDTGNMDLYEKSARIESVMEREKAAKGIYPNVDFYSATTYHCIGLPLDLFTPMFVLSRVGGWAGHILEQLADNRLYRPDVHYTGPHGQKYVEIGNR